MIIFFSQFFTLVAPIAHLDENIFHIHDVACFNLKGDSIKVEISTFKVKSICKSCFRKFSGGTKNNTIIFSVLLIF